MTRGKDGGGDISYLGSFSDLSHHTQSLLAAAALAVARPPPVASTLTRQPATDFTQTATNDSSKRLSSSTSRQCRNRTAPSRRHNPPPNLNPNPLPHPLLQNESGQQLLKTRSRNATKGPRRAPPGLSKPYSKMSSRY